MTLPDVNVWLAGVWARHVDHKRAKAWLDDGDEEYGFCRVTEMALLRLLTNPTVTGTDVRTRREAWDIVLALQDDPRVRFMNEPRGLAPVWMAISKRDDHSHHLWTDDYLAAFAQVADADFVTLDRRCYTRYPSVRVRVL